MWKLASQIGSQLRQGAEKVANQLEKIDLGFSKETASDLQLRLEEEAARVCTEEQVVLKKNEITLSSVDDIIWKVTDLE